jgi:hypothetical protein
LPNLLSEKASLIDIEKAQRSANDAFLQKIAYIASEEKIQEVLEKTKEKVKQLAGAELSRARVLQSGSNLANIGATPAQIEAQKKSGLDFVAIVKDNAKNEIEKLKKELIDIKEAFDNIFSDLGTSRAEQELKNKVITNSPSKTSTSTPAESKTKKAKEKQEDQFSTLPIIIDSTAKIASDASDKFFSEEAAKRLEYFKEIDDQNKAAQEKKLSDLEFASQRELSLEDSKFVNKITSEEQYQLNRIDVELRYAELRLAYLEEAGLKESDLYRKTELDKLNLVTARQQQELQNEKRTERLKQAVKNQSLEVGKNALSAGIALLSKDEAARKKNASAIKAFETANILVNLYSEISGYFKGYSKLPFIGQVLAIAQSGIATARSYAAINQIRAQKFDGGGLIPELTAGRINEKSNIDTLPGGDSILATVTPGEVILNQAQQLRLGGPQAFKNAGVPGFETGGIIGVEPKSTSSNVMEKTMLLFANAVDTFSKVELKSRVVYSDFDKVSKEISFIKKLSQS